MAKTTAAPEPLKKKPIRFGYVRTKTGGFFPVIIAGNGKVMLNEEQNNLTQLKKTFASLVEALAQQPDVAHPDRIIEVAPEKVWPKNSAPKKKTSKQ